MAFTIVFTPHAREHLKAMRKAEQQRIADAIDAQLIHQPSQPTRNRKHLDENPLAPWELRVGDFRVFYDIGREDNRVVIIAIGRKVRAAWSACWSIGRSINSENARKNTPQIAIQRSDILSEGYRSDGSSGITPNTR